MNDLIYRQDLLEKMKTRKGFYGRRSDPVCLVEDAPAIEAIPIIHGYWEIVGGNTVKCSICGEISCCKGKYCSDCGARMDKEDI